MWTTESPKDAGWFWLNWRGRITMAEVYQVGGWWYVNVLSTTDTQTEAMKVEGLKVSSLNNALWCGPLSPPI